VAKTVLTNVRLFVGPADLTGVNNKVELNDAVEEKETTNFGSGGAKEFIGGLESLTFAASGQWQAGSTTTTDIDDEMWGDRRINQAYSIAPVGTTVGNPAYLTQAVRLSSKLFGQVGDVAPWELAAAGSWPLARGMVAQDPGTAIAANGNGTGIQLGALSATQRIYGSLHLLSVSGTSSPTLAVTIQSAAANTFVGPTTRLTFNTLGPTNGSDIQRSAAGAVTDTWWRAVFTVTGSTPSFLAFIALAND
jgi:hypothetical protein